jgi:hypothetical protein
LQLSKKMAGKEASSTGDQDPHDELPKNSARRS